MTEVVKTIMGLLPSSRCSCFGTKVRPCTILLCILFLYCTFCIVEYTLTESLPPIITRTVTTEERRESSTRLSTLQANAKAFLATNTHGANNHDHDLDLHMEISPQHVGVHQVKYLVMYSGPTEKRPKWRTRSIFGAEVGRSRHHIYADNFEFFIKYGLHNNTQTGTAHVDFVIVLTKASLPEWEDKLNALNMPNLHIMLRSPNCYDMQSYIVALQAFDYRQYDRIIGVNCGLRGPFLPPYLRHIVQWPVILGSFIDDEVKLAGLSQNRDGTPRVGPQRHVQSMIWVTDPVGLSVILAAGCMFDCTEDVPGREMGKDYLIQRYEIGMSLAIKRANYKLRAWNNFQLNKEYCNDHKSVSSPERKVYPHGPEFQGEWRSYRYFGRASPYEMMFVKYTVDLVVHEHDKDQSKAVPLKECSADDKRLNAAFYDDWYTKWVEPRGAGSNSKSKSLK